MRSELFLVAPWLAGFGIILEPAGLESSPRKQVFHTQPTLDCGVLETQTPNSPGWTVEGRLSEDFFERGRRRVEENCFSPAEVRARVARL